MTTDPHDARAALIAYSAGTRTVTADGLAPLIDAVIAEAAPSAAVSPPPATDRAGLRGLLAAALRDAACVGNCGLSEVECYAQRIQPEVWHHGVLAAVSGTPEMLADAMLAVLPPDGRPDILLWAADAIDRKDAEQGSPESGVRWATSMLRRLAAGERDEQQAQQGGPETRDDAYTLALRYADALAGSGHADARTWSYALRWFSQLVHGGGLARYARDSFGIKFGIEAPAPAPAPAAEQPPADTGEEADRIVAYSSPGGTALYCTRHSGEVFGTTFEPIASEDLPDGGICTYPECGADVLIPQEESRG